MQNRHEGKSKHKEKNLKVERKGRLLQKSILQTVDSPKAAAEAQIVRR